MRLSPTNLRDSAGTLLAQLESSDGDDPRNIKFRCVVGVTIQAHCGWFKLACWW
jgi:hypothetical protein